MTNSLTLGLLIGVVLIALGVTLGQALFATGAFLGILFAGAALVGGVYLFGCAYDHAKENGLFRDIGRFMFKSFLVLSVLMIAANVLLLVETVLVALGVNI